MSVISTGQLEASINIYRQQQATVNQQLASLEQQKAVGVRTVEQLSGAIQACEALIQTIKNQDELEAAEAAKAAPEPATVVDALPIPDGLPSVYVEPTNA